MSQQQQSSPSFLSNSVLVDGIFIGFLPDELEDSLLTGDNLEEGNQPPKHISKAAKPRGIDEATSGFNKKQVIKIETRESERKEAEEEEETVNANERARIDVNLLADRVKELEKMILKKKYPGSLEVRLKKRPSSDRKIYYINYVRDGRILNAVEFINRASYYMVESLGARCGCLKCVCPYCQESGIEIFGRSNTLLEHMRRTQDIKVQCIYCDELFQSHKQIKDHIRRYHWKLGENVF